ncbi:hypothetical protein FPV67DRAFT_1674627 [Lyophyllum atratum]|nr:hypothetical protein FPV67DRAFT_1674627 [Lyophyllum atratum]
MSTPFPAGSSPFSSSFSFENSDFNGITSGRSIEPSRVPPDHNEHSRRIQHNGAINFTGASHWERPGSRDDPWQIVRTLDAQLTEVVHQNEKLARQITRLEISMEESQAKLLTTIRYSQTAIIEALKSSPLSEPPKPEAPSLSASLPILSASLPIPCMDQDDYPDIKYWFKKDYIAAKKDKKTFSTIHTRKPEPNGNTMTWYVEDEDGDPVNGHHVDRIRADARSIWVYLRDNNMAPATWAEANIAALNYYEHYLCDRHPELSYGANNWKAHQIATDNYPSWSSSHLPRAIKIKTEPITRKPLKRSGSSLKRTSSRPIKKSRPMLADADTTPVPQPISVTKTRLKIKDPLSAVFDDPFVVATTQIPTVIAHASGVGKS